MEYEAFYTLLRMLTFTLLLMFGLWHGVSLVLGYYHPSLDDKVNFLIAVTTYLAFPPSQKL